MLLWWDHQLIQEVEDDVRHDDDSVRQDVGHEDGWDHGNLVRSDDEDGYHDDHEVVRQVGV